MQKAATVGGVGASWRSWRLELWPAQGVRSGTPPVPHPPPCLAQVKEVPPAAAAWAEEYHAERQGQQGPAVWGDEFASFQAQQHPAAVGERWEQEFEGAGQSGPGGGGCAYAWQCSTAPAASSHVSPAAAPVPPCLPAGAQDWADQFAEGLVGGGQWAQEFADGRGSTGDRLQCLR